MTDRGVIDGQGVLDLTRMTKEDLAGISGLANIGAVVVPESLAGAYAAIPAEGIGGTVYVPDGAKIRVHAGTLVVGGDGLGASDETLVLVGSMVITSPVTGELPQRINVVGSLIAPRGSESALGAVLGDITGAVAYYRYVEGQQVKVQSGQVRLSGAALANMAGEPSDILVASGQVIITGEVGEIGYSQLFLSGQVIAPETAQARLEPRLDVQGQVVWYRSGDPRMFMDEVELGADFFRLLDHKITLLVFGDLTISAGVTAELLMEKVADLVLFGDAVAPAEAVPALQVLATSEFGRIRTANGSHG
jgi:hypothetical protein